ncbi:hypothetical protein [Paracraurococcus ruber]|uniref:hypothetical protein n=1 Tax=Paracraurococcus ruber TaxID=77675 RepID=UPI001863B3EF|nr:hypothetical protein [Paracraurococcus ruber]
MSCGPLLRRWRLLRGESQLDFALAADTSARHLSFLETGRAQNEPFLAAGFAPAFRHAPDLAAPRNVRLAEALRLVLKAQHPNVARFR